MPSSLLSTEISDPINARILAVSEDRIAGFHEDPFAEIARLSGLPLATVLERLRAMLEAGVVRRIRQTLMATNLAHGALADQIKLGATDSGPILSDREQEVLRLTAGGNSVAKIGEHLHLSAATVKTHLQHTYRKLGVSDRAAAVAEAMRRGLME